MFEDFVDPYEQMGFYQPEKVLNHENYFQVEKNIHVIKNFTSQEEREFFINIAENGTKEQWAKDERDWWKNKMLFVGEENMESPVIHNILSRIQDLFPYENQFIAGMNSVHRMVPGESMFAHSDNPYGEDRIAGKTNTNYVIFGMVLYHTDFNGGEVYYNHLDISYKPDAGDLLMHPGSVVYTHSTKPVLPGPNRYISTTFLFDEKAKKLKESGLVLEDIETMEANDIVVDPISRYHMDH